MVAAQALDGVRGVVPGGVFDQRPGEPEAQMRIALVGVGERAAVERDRFSGEPGSEALLGERHAVIDAAADFELVHPRAEILVRIERPREVARRAPRADRLARPREHLEEVVGEAAGDREREDDEHPVARRARAIGVHDEAQLDEDVQREYEGHAAPFLTVVTSA
jgi:hypothetical protein